MSRPQSRIRYGNRLIQQKQDTENLQKHYQSLKKARPMTGNTIQRNAIMINNKKGQMVQENKFTQIQRENRILFTKITTIMSKGTISQSQGINDRSIMNKTLNGVHRKKQLQKIQYENARMLKRLKQKKSSYAASGLHKDWQKKKKVIQNMSFYPYIINDNIGAQIKRQKINDEFLMRHHSTFEPQINFPNRQLRRIRKIDGCMFLISIKFEGDKLFIIGDIKEEQNIKIIELQRKQAESFIIDECDGNVENLFGLLRFDRESGDLYLVGKDVGEIERVKEFQIKKRKSTSQYETRGRKSLQRAYHPPRPISKQLLRKNNYTLSDNNQEQQYMDLGRVTGNQQKMRIKSKLNTLQQQMNEEISRNIKTKQVSQRQVNSNKQIQQIKGYESQMKKQALWVKVQNNRLEEQQLQQPTVVHAGDEEIENHGQVYVQNDINYEEQPNQQNDINYEEQPNQQNDINYEEQPNQQNDINYEEQPNQQNDINYEEQPNQQIH